MAVETELKLRIAPEDMARLKRHPFLKALAAAPAVSRKLYNIYFDTPGLDLHGHAMALRLRRVGGSWVQTLKGGGGVEAGLHSRNEWETPVAGEALEFAALEACGGKLPPGVEKKLRPVFATDFTRSVRQLSYEGAAIELCMDSGEIRAGSKIRPISELELELKSGEPRQLFRLALALIDIVPLEVEHISKAEYGYRLAFARKRQPDVVRLPKLEASQSIAAAMRDLISACLLQVQTHLPGVLWKPEGDSLPTLRAALSRLCAVLDMAAAWQERSELTTIRSQIEGLCAEIDAAAEVAAFSTEILAPLRAEFPRRRALSELARAGAKMGTQRHGAVLARLASLEVPRLLLRAGLWMQDDDWRKPPGKGAETLIRFAQRILESCSRQVQACGAEIGNADAIRLTALRVASHRLRDSAEMLATLFPAENPERYLAALSALQGGLERLVPPAAGASMLDEMGSDKWRQALDLVRERLVRDRSSQAAALKRVWERFVRAPAFWD